MAMNPRLLKPTASGFNPRSISGLALWLDASSTDTLYTTDAGPVTAVASPLDIAGCLCWYDAADASSITKDGSNLVSQWNDKSGNSRHATTSGSLRPTSGGSQNGRTVMQFTGTQAMTITGNFLQSDNVTMFAVAMKNTDHYGGIITSAPTNPEDSPVMCFYLTTIAWLNRRQLVQQATGNGVYRIVSGQSVGTAQQGFFDGVRGTDTVASIATNTTGTITKIGALRASSTADLNGNIAEIVCYSGNLTTADRARVEAYLADKWGISGVHRPVAQELTAVGSPLELADCALWLDADQSVTPSLFDATVGGSAVTAENGTVARWQDKSGNNRHATQAESAIRPLFKNSSYNGRPCLNGSGDRFMVCEGANINAASLTLFAVYRIAEWQATDNGINPNIYHTDILASGYTTLGLRSEQGGGTMNVRIGDADSSAPYTLAGITSTHQNQTAIQATRLNGSTGAIVSRASGTQAASATVAGTNIPASFGSRVAVMTGFQLTDPGRRWRGDLAEFIIFRRDLSDTDMQRVEKYLAAKWGIANVPDPTPPVGYWGDKSRNGRHAVQATAASRPTVRATAQNGRKNLAFATQGLNGTFSPELASTEYTVAAVVQTTGTTNNQRVFSTSASAGVDYATGRVIPILNNASGVGSLSAYTTAGNVSPASGFSAYGIFTGVLGSGIVQNSVNGGRMAPASATMTSATGKFGVGETGHHDGSARLAGSIAELLYYSRAVTPSELRRIETYLASRWGITLAPQVANADAQDWINRVYQNGGTVSSATGAAVNTFCESIASAGIRDRFYRLNLFCGSNLNAALMPLYQTPYGAVTNLFQFGTDMTNPAWLAGGNGNVTRAVSTEVGPLGYGFATKLTTPSAPFDVRQMHQFVPVENRQATLSFWAKTNTGTRQVQYLFNGEYLDTITITSTWTRYTKTRTSTVAGGGRTGLSTVSELSDAAGFILIWGMQIESGATATDYNQPRYGNATDTNVGSLFVGGNYSETTGLTAPLSSSNYLDTGFTTVGLPAGVYESMHMSGWHGPIGSLNTDPFLLGVFSTERYGLQTSIRTAAAAYETGRSGKTNTVLATNGVQGARPSTFLLTQRTSATSLQLYRDGMLENTAATSVTGIGTVAIPVFVFAYNNAGTRNGDQPGMPLRHYSIGDDMTEPQVLAFYNALAAFNTAMGRTA